MTRVSFSLLVLLVALPSCKSVTIGGDGVDGGGGTGGGMTLVGCDQKIKVFMPCANGEPIYTCANGLWNIKCPDTSPVGGQGGMPGTGGAAGSGGAGGTSGTGTCQPRTFDADCFGGETTYTCVQRGGEWVWDYSCPNVRIDAGTGTCGPRTFDADCYGGEAKYTCVQRDGEWVWDHRCPDLPVDAGTIQPVDAASGCDPAKAAQAITAAGLTIVGEAQTLMESLPSSLSSGPNWGVKDSACRAGGYDLSVAAGKTVCLASFATTTLCQGVPTNAWVVMWDGAVRCIYQAVRPDSPMTPGVYAVHDSSCTSPDAGTSCPGENPASRTCRNFASECLPSSCTCGSPGSPNSWRCTADCRTAPLCPDAGAACSGTRIDNKQAASAYAEYVRQTNPQVAPRGSYLAEEKTVANLWDVLQAQLLFATWYDDDGTAGNTTAFLYRNCTITSVTQDSWFAEIDSGVVANGAFYFSWGSGSGIYRSNLGKLVPSGTAFLRTTSDAYFNPGSGPPGLVVSLENGRLVVDRARGKFNEWTNPERIGFLKDFGDRLAVVDANGKEISATLP